MAHQARKRFGQNFLHDPNVIQNIINLIHPRPDEHLVEIGPGQGAMTRQLVSSCKKFDAIELDRDLIPVLQTEFGHLPQFELHQGDALKFPFCDLANNDKLRVTGNLPYNISTPLLFHLMDHLHCIQDMHFMLQKEVVVRITAQPGDKLYGRLGIMLGYFCDSENLMTIGPGAFRPAPKVDSAIVRLTPWSSLPAEAENLADLNRVVTQAFSQRRKTLRNSMKNLLDIDEITQLGIDPSIRPEQLALQDFVNLANQLHNKQAK
ncbi:MAG: 16S rRNA (adenine(1518)-N(6)/adenine(1519)-N(6))-dimethyltransferase RsmA [Gammaproteobacteria bacterium]|nr:16S rRNA (adenine(1518)-N(6)/adenine(1519)-N(6))-dimethyltransferase RsmA [Gammaproteobacteria bacterium]